MKINGLEDSAVVGILSTLSKLGYSGLDPLEVIYLISAKDILELNKCRMLPGELEQRGFTAFAAAEIWLLGDPNDHLGLLICAISYLLIKNGFEEHVEIGPNGYPPSSYSVEQMKKGILGSVSEFIPVLQDPGLAKKMIFFAEDRNSFPKIPDEEPEYIRVYHACSWMSAGAIEIAINPAVSMEGIRKRNPKDFGVGLYTTTDLDYALYWAFRRYNTARIHETPAIIVFRIHMSSLTSPIFKVLAGPEWESFVASCRKHFNDQIDAQIIQGQICRRVQEVNSCQILPVPGPHSQICFKNKMACNLLSMSHVVIFKALNIQ